MSFIRKSEEMQTIRRQARADLTAPNVTSCFQPETLPFFHCLRTKMHQKRCCPLILKRVSWDFFRNLSSSASGRDLLVLLDPSPLHHIFLVGPAQFASLHINALQASLASQRAPGKVENKIQQTN